MIAEAHFARRRISYWGLKVRTFTQQEEREPSTQSIPLVGMDRHHLLIVGPPAPYGSWLNGSATNSLVQTGKSRKAQT